MIDRFLRSVILAAALSLCATSYGEPTAGDIVLNATPSYAALFKNGVGLIRCDIDIPKRTGTFNVRSLPEATLGSFWMHWEPGVQLENIKFTQIESSNPTFASNIEEILEANIGKEVELWIESQKEWVPYKIVDIPRKRSEPSSPTIIQNEIPLAPKPARGDIIILQRNDEKEAVPMNWIQSIRRYKEDNLSQPKIENVIQFDANENNPDTPTGVSITYLAKGIAWAPSYVLDVTNKDKAVITAKAVLVNDLQTLINTNVELIAGYPNIEYSETPCAFSMQKLQDIFNRLPTPTSKYSSSYRIGNPIASNAYRSYGVAMQKDEGNTIAAPLTPITGESAEDLYYYQLKNITLKKGERGYYPIFSHEVPYEHIYTWDVSTTANDFSSILRQKQQDRNVTTQEVWHSLKLRNDTKYPWTCAPAMTTKDGRILGQDTMYFTAAGQSAKLKVTQAVSITPEQNEYEITRDRNALNIHGLNYDLVTIHGELDIVNYKEETVVIEINKTVTGEVKEYDGEPAISLLFQGSSYANPNTRLTWNVEVKPGLENRKKITYTFTKYTH